MKTYTDDEGLAAIEIAKRISATAKEAAIIRLFAISQVFYRHSIGVRAIDEMHALIGWEATNAIFFISGFSGVPATERWAEIARIGVPEPSAGEPIPIVEQP